MPFLRLTHCGDSVAVDYQPGARATVLLIHSNSTSRSVFAQQVEALRRQDFGVITFDLPGHGESDDAADPENTYAFLGYASVIATVLDQLALDAVHVVGWSLGGHIALETMGRDSRVRSVMIWGTPPAPLDPTILDEVFRVSPAFLLAGKRTFTPEECRIYAGATTGPHMAPSDEILAAMARTDGRARETMMTKTMSGVGLDARHLVATDPRPLAILHGADDGFVRLTYLQRLTYRNLWQNQIHVVPGVGHAAHLEAPAAVNALMLAFLDQD